MELAFELLQRHFGLRAFRNRQQEIIAHVLRGHHALVIMPTGMGKSLCFQIPALVLAEQRRRDGGLAPLTLVLSPLIALMKDQVDGLVSRGIAATYVNASLTRPMRETRYRELREGGYDLLYVTPERFRKPDFLEVIASRTVTLLAVDEAHCISEWGHDFRPDYSRVREIREQLGSPTTIALTATATPDVQADIVQQLGLAPEQVTLFHSGIDRPNLSLQVETVWDDDEKLNWILETCRRNPGSGIVYFTLIRTLEAFSERLHGIGVSHLRYHGDLSANERREVQDQFMHQEDQVVLATNAFGMGVDKESIRFVLHADLPGSLEAYYQEIGRAGRDGLPASCLLIYDERDLATQMEFLQWSNPDAAYYQRVYDFLQHEGEAVNAFGLDHLRSRLHFKDHHDRRLETALAMLERWGAIEGSMEPFHWQVVAELPQRLRDATRMAEKLRRDQLKLLAVVRYVQTTDDRKAFLMDYFGLT